MSPRRLPPTSSATLRRAILNVSDDDTFGTLGSEPSAKAAPIPPAAPTTHTLFLTVCLSYLLLESVVLHQENALLVVC